MCLDALKINSLRGRRRGFAALALLFWLMGSSCSTLNPPPFDESEWRRKVDEAEAALLYAPHWNNGKFFNPWMPRENRGFTRLLSWKLASKPRYSDEEEEYRSRFIAGLPDRIALLGEEDFIAWVGHATFLMRLNGEFWITDPMLSERALLPKRKTPPALSGDELAGLPGRLNVIISHNHYDHLDVQTIQRLPPGSRIYAPLGLKDYLRKFHKGEVIELDWWQTQDCGKGTRLVCLPAQHWSRRITQSVNSTLWASFLLVSQGRSIYYGGDSGYFKGYKEIGRRYPGIDYALLPIGAYHPRWFMHYAHMDVKEVLEAFEDLGAGYLIPTQWGTFRLGDEPIGYPVLDLKRRLPEHGLDHSRVLMLDLGQIVSLR